VESSMFPTQFPVLPKGHRFLLPLVEICCIVGSLIGVSGFMLVLFFPLKPLSKALSVAVCCLMVAISLMVLFFQILLNWIL
jgi:hypothetical protein